MLSRYIRVIHSDDGVLSDVSLASQGSDSIAIPLVATEDYIYIGQYLAFNNIFSEVTTANDQASVLSIDLWNGNEWKPAVDILDSTSSSGATFAQDGVIQWSVNPDYNWKEIADTSEETNSGLTSLNIYNLHWIRIKVSANLAAGTIINRIKYKFTEDSALIALDPDLANIKTAWSDTKTDWLDQILSASEMLAADLKSRGQLKRISQILRLDEVYLPCAYKTLSIIYGGLGDEFIERKNDARHMYYKLLGNIDITVDNNNNGIVEKSEINTQGGGVYR